MRVRTKKHASEIYILILQSTLLVDLNKSLISVSISSSSEKELRKGDMTGCEQRLKIKSLGVFWWCLFCCCYCCCCFLLVCGVFVCAWFFWRVFLWVFVVYLLVVFFFFFSFLGVSRVFRFDFFQKILFSMQSTFKVNDVKNNNFRVSPVRKLWYILARKYSNY